MGPAATVNQEFLYSFMKEAVSGANQWTGLYDNGLCHERVKQGKIIKDFFESR